MTETLLAPRVRATPNRTALVDASDGRTWSYRELDALVEQAADRLADRAGEVAGIDAGADPRVGTLFAPSPAFVVTVHAAWRLGWTVVGLDTRLPPATRQDRIQQADVDILAHGGTVERPDATGTPAVAGAQLVDGGVPDDPPPATVPQPVRDRLSESGGGVADTAPTAVVLFTSGTTGRPKAVRLTRENLRASAVASAFRLGVSPGDRWLCCLPVHHMGGLAPVVRTALYGTTLVVQRSFEAESTARVLAEHAITGVSLVPTQLRRLLDAGAELSALSTVLVGGAPLSESLCERALRADVAVYPTYGLTEAASQVATARPGEVRDHPGTVGQPLYGTGVTVVDDGGDPVDAGERGELVVAGPTVTPGYLDADATEAAFGDRGLHTGDIGVRDEDGRLWVVGRRDDMVLTGGELVAPRAVAETLRDHPDVADAAVVGLDDEEWGQRLAALVVPDGDLDTAAVHEHCRNQLPGHRRPKVVVLAETLPRTVSGTVDRDAVRAAVRECGGHDGA